MKIGSRSIQFSLRFPKTVILLTVLAALICGALTSTAVIDTDPENLLAEDEPVRVFHDRVKQEFSLHDLVVVGIVNEEHPDGVFNPISLKHVQEITDYLLTLADPEDPTRHVIARDVYALGNVDNIKQAGPGEVRFEWLMKSAPATRKGALAVREAALANPLLKGTLVSEDGTTIGIFAPVSTKDYADQVRTALLGKIAEIDDGNGDEYHITGLPVAEDSFGKALVQEMFVAPPLAMLVIFLLMLLFFKKVKLVIAPMLVAMFSVVCAMGLLNISGSAFHIMSSMIPTFLMPIAIVDGIHILSEFFDIHPAGGDRRRTLERVMDELFAPMLYTSLTSAVGFASLTLAPIPPIRIFGIFVAVGIMLAWLFTITFIPAYIMLLKEETVAEIGSAARKLKKVGGSEGKRGDNTVLARTLRPMGRFAIRNSRTIMICGLLLGAGACFGITKLQQNDYQMNWFSKDHPIRVADRELNNHLDGTHQLYLVLEGAADDLRLDSGNELVKEELGRILRAASADPALEREVLALAGQLVPASKDLDDYLEKLILQVEKRQQGAPDATYAVWADLLASLERIRNRQQIFKRPEMLRYLGKMQDHLMTSAGVGKSNSITDIVKKVHQELFLGKAEMFRVPDSERAVAECLLSYQNSHRPSDLWHFVTPDFRKANVWIQMQEGDNMTTQAVVDAVEQFMVDNPPPAAVTSQWAGLSYINIIWQEKMVTGMGNALKSSFAIVLLMMILLFRSPLWGALAMLPLSITVVTIYGMVGWVGKDYDMPIAVLSSLSLGLAVDFAIHFLQRTRENYEATNSWAECVERMFEEPARAISRNIIVIAVGFVPLLLSSLTPYRTTGLLFASIMVLSGVCTLLLLPAILTAFEEVFFGKTENVDFEELQIQEE